MNAPSITLWVVIGLSIVVNFIRWLLQRDDIASSLVDEKRLKRKDNQIFLASLFLLFANFYYYWLVGSDSWKAASLSVLVVLLTEVYTFAEFSFLSHEVLSEDTANNY